MKRFLQCGEFKLRWSSVPRSPLAFPCTVCAQKIRLSFKRDNHRAQNTISVREAVFFAVFALPIVRCVKSHFRLCLSPYPRKPLERRQDHFELTLLKYFLRTDIREFKPCLQMSCYQNILLLTRGDVSDLYCKYFLQLPNLMNGVMNK